MLNQAAADREILAKRLNISPNNCHISPIQRQAKG
jgi:hypothetical protein